MPATADICLNIALDAGASLLSLAEFDTASSFQALLCQALCFLFMVLRKIQPHPQDVARDSKRIHKGAFGQP